MPRKNVLVTIDELKKMIEATRNASDAASRTAYKLAKRELDRRERSGRNGGRPAVKTGKRAEQLREAQRRFREKQKEAQPEGLTYELEDE